MLRSLSKLFVCLGLVVSTQGFSSAAIISTLRNTGVNAAGTLVLAHGATDTNYTAVSVPSGSSVLVAQTSAGGFPIGPWLGDNTISRWITPNNSGDNDPAGNYVIRHTFSLSGFNHTTASFSGRWASDNGASMYLNNVLISSTAAFPSSNSFTTWTTFSASSGFISGLNTLEFRVNNATNAASPMGLRVEFQNSFVAVPLPASLALLLTGIPGLAMVRRRIARQS